MTANSAPTNRWGGPRFSHEVADNALVLCPLCSQRKARRACPAVGRQICAICCGTKRLVEIACPSDCPYLATAREHPPAATVRRQQHDVTQLVEAMRDLGERQSQLFWLINAFLVDYKAPELQPLIDADVVDAAGALASTLETSARGVIYEHRPASAAAERLIAALKPVLNEASGGRPGTAFERDAAVVMRRIEQAARARARQEPANQQAYLELLRRVIRRGSGAEGPGSPEPEQPRLIVP